MPKTATQNAPVSAERLKSFIQRIERQEEEKASVAADLKEIYSEAKSAGFQTSIIRKIVVLRKKEIEQRREEQELLNIYMDALGIEARRDPIPFTGPNAGRALPIRSADTIRRCALRRSIELGNRSFTN